MDNTWYDQTSGSSYDICGVGETHSKQLKTREKTYMSCTTQKLRVAMTGLLALLLLTLTLPAVVSGEPVCKQESQVVQSNTGGNSYRADIFVRGPVRGTSGRRFNFTITFTELSDLTKLGSAMVKLPDLNGTNGFSDYRINAEDSSATGGKKWAAMIVEHNGRYYINLKARTTADYLGKNEAVSVSFTSSVPVQGSVGTYEFETRAWTDHSSRDSMRVNSETGLPENLNQMAEGYKNPAIYVELPAKTGSDSYFFSNSRAQGLTAELTAKGTGFSTMVFSTDYSVAFLTRVSFPALHTYSTTLYQPTDEGRWNATTIADAESVDLLQGYTADWRSYYHREINPGKREVFSSLLGMLKEQAEFENRDLSGLSESALKELAHQENVSYYYTELASQSEQIWFAGVTLEPGAKGVLIKRIDSSYGSTAHIFDQNDDLWSASGGYRGPAYGFGFVRDRNGYKIERGRDYPGSYVDIEQVADASRGKLVRYIDISSPYSKSYLREDMVVSGSGKVDEILSSSNISPGAFLDWPGSASFSDDWDAWFFPNQGSSSAVFDSPVLNSEAQGGGSSVSENEPVQVASGGGDQGSDEDEADEGIILPSLASTEPEDEEPVAAEHSGEGNLEYAADLSRQNSSLPLMVLSVIAALIVLTVAMIVVVIIKNRKLA
jgi:hypothetical protein